VLDPAGMVVLAAGPPAGGPGVTSAAAGAFRAIVADPSVGILVDTTPGREGVVGAAFSQETPGYQQLDIPDIRIMGAATGAGGGTTVCDLVVHELTEAHAARKASLATGVVGRRAFEAAHAEGVKAEAAVRTELKLPLRPGVGGGGDDEQLFETPAAAGERDIYYLSTTPFGSGKTLRTQLQLFRLTIHLDAAGNPTGASSDVIAEHVVAGAVHFKGRRAAIETFNKYAPDFGYKAVTIPPGVK
jgi:hypothetical protein